MVRGAIAIALADRVLMQQNAIYSVISPEGCAMILWRDAGQAKKAAAAFKPDAAHCLELGVIDGIVPEPPGGAHTIPDEAARLLGDAIRESLDELVDVPGDELRRRRRARFRSPASSRKISESFAEVLDSPDDGCRHRPQAYPPLDP